MGLLSLFAGTALIGLRPEVLASYHYSPYVVAVTHLFTLGWISSIIMGAMYQLVPVALETRLHSERLARWQFIFHFAGCAGMVWMFWRWNMTQVGHFGALMGLGILLFVYNIFRTLLSVPRWNVVAVGIVSAIGWLLATMLAGLYVVADKCWGFRFFDALPQMHAHAHLGVIGFFFMMIVAVSYKLVPMFVIGEIQRPARAWTSIILLNVGLLGLVITLVVGSAWKLAFACVVLAGFSIYGLEMRAILRARKRRQLDWGLRYFLTGVGLLLPLGATALILCWPGLPATLFTTQLENVYGFLALLGGVTLALLGMLYKIIPFLVWYARYSKEIGHKPVPSLASLYSARIQKIGYWLYVAGLLGLSVATVTGSERGVRWTSFLLDGSLALFALNVGRILSHLVRREAKTQNRAPVLKQCYDHAAH